jgi:hypothetical protein
VTERQDDDDLMTDTDEPTQILGTASIRSASRKSAPANGSSSADEQDGTESDVPALPADTIGLARDSFTFSRPVSAPVSPGPDEDWMVADSGAPAPADESDESAAAEPEPQPDMPESFVDEPPVAGTGTGWPVDTSLFDAGTSAAADPPLAQPSSGSEPGTVSAAAFRWDAPEPAPTSPSSPARNFLRSSASAKTTVPPRPSPVSVGPGKAQAGPAAGPRPSAGARPKGSAKRQARQAHLTIARVEPWSVMKFSFVVSLVAFVILFIAVSVIYGTLSALGVFTSLQHVVQSVTSSQDSNGVNASKWFTASRVLSYTALLGALNIVLITAMSTIGAVVYNLTSRLIGGVEVTLRETE